MALTQGAWSSKTVNGVMVASCTVVSTTAESDAYTLKTPTTLNPRKPWFLVYYASATPDGQALPLDIWMGFDSDFAITGDSTTVAATSGVQFKQIFDDVVLAVTPLFYCFEMDPALPVADVVTVAALTTGPKVRIPVAPYYAFNLDGGSTLAAVTHYFKIIQAQ